MQDGPFVIEGLTDLRNRKGPLETQPRMALCRCGESSNKPFCDGTHAKVGFSSAKLDGRPADKRYNYAGSENTIHDNRGICAHAARCTEGLPAVFKLGTEPWIDPNGASASRIREVIKNCPSGALSVTVGGVEHRDGEGDPAVFIAPNGPYVVSGGPELLETPRGEGVSTEHCTLCRCGGSKNKPFCDGTHWHNKFIDDKN
jgi:CDGSH-type Zn-finger protein